MFHQYFEFRRFMTLAGGQNTSHQFAFAFDPQMQFGTETTLTFA
jgi:hypothetical protein